MSEFDPQRLTVNLLSPAANIQPVIGRKYTLTHSDDTGELFLDIGYAYNLQAINQQMRDEVLGEWMYDRQSNVVLVGNAYVDNGEYGEEEAKMRFEIFQKEMPTAIKGMIYGDRVFFSTYPHFLNAPIYINYHSTYPQFKRVFFYGTPGHYLSQISQSLKNRVSFPC
ncbi:staygreen family protein [Ornithinibacillus halophilus]|uniref:Staygreen protein n=1 Tax=Ornithinibacillus halophilus TaxID=930117 RepID=A0A1M5LAI0_9BACI|nr:staygreen family protein [Ornithinibacillus halophilus]SHG61945.1 Staygreen protein [Ornithinibacillus halophilus]